MGRDEDPGIRSPRLHSQSQQSSVPQQPDTEMVATEYVCIRSFIRYHTVVSYDHPRLERRPPPASTARRQGTLYAIQCTCYCNNQQSAICRTCYGASYLDVPAKIIAARRISISPASICRTTARLERCST